MENLARYSLRASFSRERMTYIRDDSKVTYQSKDGKDEEIVKKILKHLGLWDRKARPPPKATGPPKVREYSIDYSHRGVGPYGPEAMSQLSCFPDMVNDKAGSDKWLYIDPEYPENFPA